MKKLTITLISVLALAATPALAMKHEHGSHGDQGSHGQKHGSGHSDHAGMMKDAGTAMLGEQTVEGIKAMSHVKDVQAAMAKVGLKETHHYMVNFVGKDGKAVTEGTVAVKIKGPAGKESDPIALMGMQGHFGADVVLAEKGIYEFKVGSKLPDGKVRQYEFKYEVK